MVGDYYYSNNAGALFIYQLVSDEYDLIDTVIGDKAGDKLGVSGGVCNDGDLF